MLPDNIVMAYVLAACSRRLCLDAQMCTQTPGVGKAFCISSLGGSCGYDNINQQFTMQRQMTARERLDFTWWYVRGANPTPKHLFLLLMLLHCA